MILASCVCCHDLMLWSSGERLKNKWISHKKIYPNAIENWSQFDREREIKKTKYVTSYWKCLLIYCFFFKKKTELFESCYITYLLTTYTLKKIIIKKIWSLDNLCSAVVAALPSLLDNAQDGLWYKHWCRYIKNNSIKKPINNTYYYYSHSPC